MNWLSVSCCGNCFTWWWLRIKVVLKWSLHFDLQFLLRSSECSIIFEASDWLLLFVLLSNGVSHLSLKCPFLLQFFKLLVSHVFVYHRLSHSLLFCHKFLSIQWIRLGCRSYIWLTISSIFSYLQLSSSGLRSVLFIYKISRSLECSVALFILSMARAFGFSLIMSSFQHFDMITHILAILSNKWCTGSWWTNMSTKSFRENTCTLFSL